MLGLLEPERPQFLVIDAGEHAVGHAPAAHDAFGGNPVGDRRAAHAASQIAYATNLIAYAISYQVPSQGCARMPRDARGEDGLLAATDIRYFITCDRNGAQAKLPRTFASTAWTSRTPLLLLKTQTVWKTSTRGPSTARSGFKSSEWRAATCCS